MLNHQVVSAKDVLRATQQVQRRGLLAIIRDLESVEPDLAEYFLEETTALHASCVQYGLLFKQSQKLLRETQSLCLTLILACHFGNRRFAGKEGEGVELPQTNDPPRKETT